MCLLSGRRRPTGRLASRTSTCPTLPDTTTAATSPGTPTTTCTGRPPASGPAARPPSDARPVGPCRRAFQTHLLACPPRAFVSAHLLSPLPLPASTLHPRRRPLRAQGPRKLFAPRCDRTIRENSGPLRGFAYPPCARRGSRRETGQEAGRKGLRRTTKEVEMKDLC